MFRAARLVNSFFSLAALEDVSYLIRSFCCY